MHLLMVVFHLAFFSATYPYAHQVVYAFHMPIFLLLSGYFTRVHIPITKTLKRILWFFVPYAIMESGYVIMAAQLPINEHIEQLTFLVFVEKLFLHPIGPYWFLHTLILCTLVVQLLSLLRKKLAPIACFIVLGIIFYGLSLVSLISFSNAVYFLVGLAIATQKRDFRTIFPATFWAILPIVLLIIPPKFTLPNAVLYSSMIRGIMLCYFMICFLLAIFKAVNTEGRKEGAGLPLIYWAKHVPNIVIFTNFHHFVQNVHSSALFRPNGVAIYV